MQMETQSWRNVSSVRQDDHFFFLNEQTVMLIKTGAFISSPFACYEIATRVIYLLVCCETYILEERGSAKTTK